MWMMILGGNIFSKACIEMGAKLPLRVSRIWVLVTYFSPFSPVHCQRIEHLLENMLKLLNFLNFGCKGLYISTDVFKYIYQVEVG